MKHPRQEADVVPGRAILGVGAGAIAATVLGSLVAWGIGRCSVDDLGVGAASRTGHPTGEINAMERSVFTLEAQGTELHRRADEFLSTYGWVDRDQQIVHIPIEVAQELYLTRRAARPINAARQP